MELYVFDQNWKLAGMVEALEYLRWTRRYSASGSFELKAVATDGNLAILRPGNLIWKSDDSEAGVIEVMELTMGDGEQITLSGRFLTSLLARRIVWGTETLSGALSDMVGRLLANHLTDPADPARKMARFSYQPSAQGASVNTQVAYKNLLTTVCSLCETADVGLKTLFDPAAGSARLTLYQGGEMQGVFSREYENVLEQTFTQSTAGFANVALVAGEGDANRQLASVGNATGEARYELFVDAKDLRSSAFPNDYAGALAFRGAAKLAEKAMVKAFDATVNLYGNLRYKTDFDVGSQVRFVADRWQLSMRARITEIEESYDRSGMSLDVTLGNPLLTLAQRQEVD